jgi:predicted small lipoprotein YifL
MKRLFSILLTLALLFSLTACGGKGSGTTPEPPENSQTQEDTAPDKVPEKDPEPEQAAAPIPLQLMKG